MLHHAPDKTRHDYLCLCPWLIQFNCHHLNLLIEFQQTGLIWSCLLQCNCSLKGLRLTSSYLFLQRQLKLKKKKTIRRFLYKYEYLIFLSRCWKVQCKKENPAAVNFMVAMSFYYIVENTSQSQFSKYIYCNSM
jgi:hypothetical protein